MANYKVGDLDVTISGVSKDAVSSLDEVIKQLDTLQGKLGIVGKGFSGAFKVNNAAIRAVVGDLGDIVQTTRNATDSQQEFNEEIKNGQATAQQYSTALVVVSEAQEAVESSFRRLTALLNAPTYSRLSFDVGNLATQWKNLYTTMQRSSIADALTDGQFSQEAQNRLTRLTQEYLNKKRAIDETNEAFKRMAMTEQELVLYDYQQEQASRKQRIAYLNLMLATGQAGDKTREYTQELKRLTKQQQIADKVAGKSATGGLSKLIKQIGKIALYRTIRRGLQLITQTFRESIQAYAQVDDNINKTMSQLTSSTKIIQLSLGTIILPIIQAITPAVQQLSIGFANMSNAINKSMALAQGNATYTKINTGALKDYRKELNKTSGALFDFDKFRALSSKQDTASIFLSTEDVSALDKAESKYSGIYTLVSGIGDILGQVLRLVGQIFDAASPIIDVVFKIAGWLLKGVGYVLDFLNNVGLIEPILYGILTVLGLIGAQKIITWISSGAAKEAVLALAKAIKTNLASALTKATDLAKTAKGAFGAWGLAVATVTAAVKILSNWDEFNRGTKIAITAIATLTTALGVAFITVLALRHAFEGVAGVMTALGLGVATLASAVVAVRGLVDIPKYAMGASDIDGGAVFIAGEAGKTEMVYTGDNGKTNVANVQQMAQAVYQGTYQATMDWWKSAKNEVGGDVYLDGEKIYQNTTSRAKKHGQKWATV